MAKNSSLIKISGTLGDLTFYRMDGKDIVRRKTSLNKKRVKSDPAFENSRKSSAVFGAASSLAKETYWALPKEKIQGLFDEFHETERLVRIVYENITSGWKKDL